MEAVLGLWYKVTVIEGEVGRDDGVRLDCG